MGLPPEPDDIDFIVASHDTDPESIQEIINFIKALKSRPEHAEEVKEANRILESLSIDTNHFGKPDPGELLARWHRTIEELKRREIQESVGCNDLNEAN